jgi:hypothetical protein
MSRTVTVILLHHATNVESNGGIKICWEKPMYEQKYLPAVSICPLPPHYKCTGFESRPGQSEVGD